MSLDIKQLSDDEKSKLVEARWSSSQELWEVVKRVYKHNTAVYENKADWLQHIPYVRQKFRIQANRVFVNMESVINSLIANPPGINILPAREGTPAQDFARKLEGYFRKKYNDLNIKEVLRMGLRNLYFGRLLVIKPFWNPIINDFDYRSVDPRNIRVGKYARKEQDSEFAIEEIEDNLCAVIERFPSKKQELMAKYGITDEVQLYIKNPDVKYKEAWIQDYVIFKLENIVLDTIRNPYWDWEGILLTEDEQSQLDGSNGNAGLDGQARRDFIQNIKLQQEQRKQQQLIQNQPVSQTPAVNPASTNQEGTPQDIQADNQPTPEQYKPYMFNYFDSPRKPYIIATIFNNENTPIGRTDMITLSAELQKGIDKRKMDIDENCELANGILKVDASVMGKSDAQRIRFETKGIIWGKGVKDGVTRETGSPLPDMVFKDMQDSRQEIDNIMAASSAFRGERDGSETKAGRLALVEQSQLRLNELTQVVDYVAKEIFDWGMQLAKTRYTEYHYAKWLSKESSSEIMEIIQDDFDNGSEVTIVAGKTLPVDDQFKYEQAQKDVASGFISPIDYLQIAGYENAKEISKNAFLYKVSPFTQYDISDEERQKIPPPVPASTLREQISFDELPAAGKVQFLARMGITVTEDQIIQEGAPSPVSIAFKDLPPDGKVQAAAKAGITLNPAVVSLEAISAHQDEKKQNEAKIASMSAKMEQPTT